MEELRKWIMEDLPYNDGWWADGYDEFIDAAEEMINKGFSVDEVKRILQSLYSAVAGEFGN